MLNVAVFGGSRNQRGFFMCLTPVIRNYCFFGFFPLIPLIVATASSISAHVFVIFAIRTRRRDFSHLRYYNDFSEEFTPGRLPGELFPRRVLAWISAIPLVALGIFLRVALI